MKRILIFGDSIAAGSNLPISEQGQTWPLMVQQMSHGAFVCLNASKGGRTTDSFAEFVETLAKNPSVDLVILALGTNDSRDLSPDCPSRAVNHLEWMIDHAQRAGVSRFLVVAPSNIRLDALEATQSIGPERERQLRSLAHAFRDMAERKGIDFVDTFGVISPEYLKRDGVHPTAQGNRQIADLILAQINLEPTRP